jgi:hypothetical protein
MGEESGEREENPEPVPRNSLLLSKLKAILSS